MHFSSSMTITQARVQMVLLKLTVCLSLPVVLLWLVPHV